MVKWFHCRKSTKIIELAPLQGLKNSKIFFLYEIGSKIVKKEALAKNYCSILIFISFRTKIVFERYIQSIIFAPQTKNLSWKLIFNFGPIAQLVRAPDS